MGCGASSEKGRSNTVVPATAPKLEDKAFSGNIGHADHSREVLAKNEDVKPTTVDLKRDVTSSAQIDNAQSAITPDEAPDATKDTARASCNQLRHSDQSVNTPAHEGAVFPSIRLFLTSGPDLYAERDVLAREVFPGLEREVRKKGLDAFTFIDFRQDLPRYTPTDSTTLLHALMHIEHCRPYYIGIIGHSYGWIPDMNDPTHISSATLVKYPWLRKYEGASTMELEMTYGALDRDLVGDDLQALFYIKAGESEQHPMSDNGSVVSLQNAQEQTLENDRLERLKARIKADAIAKVRTFDSAEHLVELMRKDLLELTSSATYLDPRLALQHSYALAMTGCLPYLQIYSQLDELVESGMGENSSKCLMLTGPPGRGVSSVLANWIIHQKQLSQSTSHPRRIVMHFAECNTESSDPVSMLMNIMHDIYPVGREPASLPATPQGIFSAFRSMLQTVSEHLIVVISSLHLLENISNAHHLSWIPDSLPPNVTLVLSSAADSAPAVAARARGWKEISVKSLTCAEKQDLISSLEDSSGDATKTRLLEAIARNKLIDDPLLIILLCSHFNNLPGGLSASLIRTFTMTNIHTILTTVLVSLEKTFAHHIDTLLNPPTRIPNNHAFKVNLPTQTTPHPLAATLALIYATHTGIYEEEIRGMLCISHRSWAAIFNAIGPLVVSSSGRVVFIHPAVRAAVETRYVPTNRLRKGVYTSLARFFFKRGEWDVRAVKEVAWALVRGGEGQHVNLCGWLVRPEVVRLLLSKGESATMFRLWNAAGGIGLAKRLYSRLMETKDMDKDEVVRILMDGKEPDLSLSDHSFISTELFTSADQQLITRYLTACESG
ncbi:uncharacterized protein SPPG_08354 [Spizellomyces punctatus DAOM BR117]|uniref:DUF4062 domain-containing protein n=1 Tax=Spizellomyces punctatus (strain DAOM BR117) TaxID=645134 RepID=A0A0L0H3Z2_SPIPD|nr:uncharacterized protein SPPG_08354 [Spizellomyces punctatus DAOM BR117]KNC96200.1 hypothetical protein SPPG_08354 [Spizellomyces punctatus DAOM BR117]|eukprot:XP_016604240.1 hypothetical protein SPPG_08354 [Spizellomyces punctatus DAOM BR117]